MKIGFDAKRAFANTSGLGNYARTLVESLARCYPENEYLAFTPRNGRQIAGWNNVRTVLPHSLAARTFPSAWRSMWMNKDIEREKLNLYHGLSNELPKSIHPPVRSVVTIHDLIFLRHPAWYKAADRKIYELKFRQACKQADGIVAVSRQTKNDITELFGTAPEKITVVYQSCDPFFARSISSAESGDFRRKRALPDRYLLSVGTIEERKNLFLAVKALRLLPGISLVAVGRKKKYFEEIQAYIKKHGLESRVHFPENVSAEELPLYYRHALALVYPSRYEGFGIPLIEALWSGTPVIAANGSALPEAGGPDSLYIDPDDEQGLADAVRKLDDNAFREKLVAAGLEYVQRFHPDQTAADMMKLYRNLV